ncbi:MAG: helix-turn-helix domain-containing protein [Clostridia bacterium]|nr:helix-turn-helix domain-containing protein [Clostridia bacterium]
MARQKIVSTLAEARMASGVSQQELANRIGTQKPNISRLESGQQNISLDTMLKIASALNKDITIDLKEKTEPPTSRYSLRLYDEELLAFSMEESGLAGMKTRLLSVNENRRDVFPLDLEVTDEGIFSWLQRRTIPKNRAFVDEILKTLGLSINNTKGIIDVCKGLSLNDSYWVVSEGFGGKFKDYNLYDNRFSNVLSLVAYTGVGHSKPVNTTSPELTTHGMLRKAWRFIEGKGIYLYKGGTEGAANAGNEPYSEYYAFQIAKRMGLNAVAYDLENWKGILASTCKLFTDIDTAYVPIGRIVRTGGIQACLDYYAKISPEAVEELKSMLVFDAVIYNEDRHFGNFGILRDNHTGKIIGPAPIFDNGLSLFNYAMQEDIDQLAAYAKTRANPYRIPYETVCMEVMGKKQRSQLHRLINFKFDRHPSLNLPEERLIAIEQHLQWRVRELLALPRK